MTDLIPGKETVAYLGTSTASDTRMLFVSRASGLE
ncbi:hypothetical protein M7I_5399 [Glarea lozoyensis 74030]|uniref:Uncharacterized protein n=1 Tax=Glarea lozoyensis (strain ATCC 74030 / MF5533) TaxID=1104152 RepID=H0ERS8_GLAL7|nr:hypothetical protein M7I_5399 [Glarea lozoyensis 74030]